MSFLSTISTNSSGNKFVAWQDAFTLQNADPASGLSSYEPEVASSGPEVVTSSSSGRRQTTATLVGRLPGTGRILCGVAVLANRLYVVRNFSSVVDVYDIGSRDFRSIPGGGVEVAGLRDPVDAAACAATGTVYVSGSADMSIFRIDGRSAATAGRWRLDRRPFGVSVVTGGGRAATVVVTFLDEPAVREFTPEGRELRGIRLDPILFANPWHAVGFCRGGGGGGSEDCVLLCHGWTKDSMTCVSVVDVTDGRVVARYGGGTRGGGGGGWSTVMDLPSHAVLVGGDALVVDLSNSRVLRLRLPEATPPPSSPPSPSPYPPEVESVLLSDVDGLKWPRSLAFDAVRGRIFVGLHEGPVLIFDCRPE